MNGILNHYPICVHVCGFPKESLWFRVKLNYQWECTTISSSFFRYLSYNLFYINKLSSALFFRARDYEHHALLWNLKYITVYRKEFLKIEKSRAYVATQPKGPSSRLIQYFINNVFPKSMDFHNSKHWVSLLCWTTDPQPFNFHSGHFQHLVWWGESIWNGRKLQYSLRRTDNPISMRSALWPQ